MVTDDTAKKKALQAKLTQLEKKVTKLTTQLNENKVTIQEYKASIQVRNDQILELEQALQTLAEPAPKTNLLTTHDLAQLIKNHFEQEVTGRAKHYIKQAQETKDQYIKLTLDNVDQKLIMPGNKLYEQYLALAIDLPVHLQKILQHKVIDPFMHQINSLLVYAEDFYQDNLKQVIVIIVQLYKMILLWIGEIKAIVKGEKTLDLALFKNSMQGNTTHA
ncbi:MAG: hypothetical protein GQ532_19735 [Methylomarinum sp.]|nr:hypothetical protein [Methylomarinum sp.]